MLILVIEDEQKVASFLKKGLEAQGFEVDLAYDSYTGEKLSQAKNYNVILLDIIIPGLNGIELCKKLKASKPSTPILMLTALGTTDDKVTGFDAGADDYLVKPFEFKELIARIKVLTKRTFTTEDPVFLQVNDLKLDLNKKMAVRGGKNIPLTAKEFALLEFLMRSKGKVVSRIDIAEKVWDINFDTGTNVVEVYVNILRKKIDKDFTDKLIQTRIGLGYIMSDGS